ncbi:16S rRNA (cytosine(967)-C(5))-methyltransferase RsmB [Roseburia sp. 1XD42-69]|uniref:16S rRNA (cytosine(967)-C(5))-methyltransferase RsmB n=1 Tax=Roseburia sp. 1XD42-69 TaxID=2320088 RepID=UPI000EA39540|nr:16S rRNA (cytosine(967)-C(5))-methyltransferase RsmB [Roseburia sp. 1XD42-69]RKJ63077.1 16S rRNA (cytosine(967)-C(5))-methyltransferase RsmB [Roseburia sp. 1XD42-69]
MTTKGENTRELVLETLLSVEKGESYSHKALSALLDKYQYLSKQERSFITRVTLGTLERRIELDYIIDWFSKVKVKKMKPVIRCILRMGVYQLKYMDSVPDSAVCNEAVKLAGKKGFGSLKGFVNGVLRSISRNLPEVSYPSEEEKPIEAVSIRCSIPQWILRQWREDYGWEKTKSMAESFLNQERTTIRVNTMMTDREKLIDDLKKQGIQAEKVVLRDYPDFKQGLYIWEYDYLLKIKEFAQGQFYVQDVSSMLPVWFLNPKEGDFVVDVCAAPGGKSIHAAQLMQGLGVVEARDLTDYKVGLIEENIARARLKNVKAVKWDALILDESLVGKADGVIADLPCSGLGVLKKKPDIRYRMTREQQEELSRLQRQILSNACQYVKPGGTLLYSTCTVNKIENEDNTAWFLENHREFSLAKERQIFPGESCGDGFYLAKMIRRL